MKGETMKQGYWTIRQEFDYDNLLTTSWTGCSECEGSILFDAKGDKVFTPYCPHCGIPMHQKKAMYQIVPTGVCPCCGRKKPKEPEEDKWVQLSMFDEEKKDD